MKKNFLISVQVVGVTVMSLFGYALFRYLMPEAPTSPIILFASYKSGVNGTLLKFRVDGTFEYEDMGFISSDVVTGRYTRTDSLLQLDRLPKTGTLKRNTLLVRPASFTETGQGIWQVGSAGQVDSTLVVFTIFPLPVVE